METQEIGDEQEQPPALGPDRPWGEREGPDIGHGLHGRTRPRRPVLLASSRQAGETLLAENLLDGGGAQGLALLLEKFADLIGGMILFSQGHDQVPGGGLLGLRLGTVPRVEEEGGVGIATQLVAEDAEGAGGITEVGGDVGGGFLVDEIGAQGFVLTLFGMEGLEEEAATIA